MDAVGLERDDGCWVRFSSGLPFGWVSSALFILWGEAYAYSCRNACRCAAMYCDSASGGSATGWYLVCEYYPPGNVEGQYAQEVGKVKYTVSGSGEAAQIANKLVNAAQGRRLGMNTWGWAIMLGVVVMGLAF